MTLEHDRVDTQDPEERLPRDVRVVIGLMLVSAFIVILNETITGVALPRLMEDLDISAGTAQWLTTGYLLTMAIVIPVTGRLLERFTTRTVFIASMSLFTAGTVIAAVASGFEMLLAGRIVQASGTALMLPLLMTTVMTFVPESRRGRMMGLISIVIAVAPATGPTVSGVILSALDWRWLFILVAPIGAIALTLGILFVKNISSPKSVYFDALSIVLSVVGFGGVIYGLSSLGESASGHAPIPPVVSIIIGAVGLALFVLRQISLQRTGRALMNLRPFKTSAFTVPLILMILSFMVLFGSLILLPLFMQNVLGLTSLQTGLTLLPGGLAMGLAAPIVGRLFDRFGPRPLVIPGTIVLSASVWALTRLGVDSTVPAIIGIHILLSLGLACLMTPLMTTALGSLPKATYPHGSAILSTLQQVAGAAGTALFITVMTTGTAAAVAGGAGAASGMAAGVHDAFLAGAWVSLAGIVLGLFVRSAPRIGRASMPLH